MTPADLDCDTLNPGIRATVRLLRALGYETTSSGDGMTHECPECDAAYPYVTIACPAGKVYKTVKKLARLVEGLGLTVGSYDENGDLDGIVIHGDVWPLDGADAEAQWAGYAFIELTGLDDALLMAALTGQLYSQKEIA